MVSSHLSKDFLALVVFFASLSVDKVLRNPLLPPHWIAFLRCCWNSTPLVPELWFSSPISYVNEIFEPLSFRRTNVQPSFDFLCTCQKKSSYSLHDHNWQQNSVGHQRGIRTCSQMRWPKFACIIVREFLLFFRLNLFWKINANFWIKLNVVLGIHIVFKFRVIGTIKIPVKSVAEPMKL